MDAVEFGKYLRNLREVQNISIRQLAMYSKVSNSYISQIENGKRGIPNPEILKKLAPYLKVSYNELMEKAGYIKPSKQINKSKSNNPQFTRRNEKEDEKPKTLEDYIEQAETLMLYGQVMDEKDREALLTAVKVAYETAIKKKKMKEREASKDE